jgi:ATP-dependent DNA helicase UvrD/PcrA
LGSSIIIELADSTGLCLKDDKLNHFIINNQYLFDRVKEVKFSEFQKLYSYLEGYTPFSTQHKTKGAEHNNVFVILDNGNWNDYNFNYLFDESIFKSLKGSSKISYPNILKRTQKIFYVCCTRTKENLVVFYHNPSTAIINQAKEWFGTDNVHEI